MDTESVSSVRMEKVVWNEWILGRQATVATIQAERQNRSFVQVLISGKINSEQDF